MLNLFSFRNIISLHKVFDKLCNFFSPLSIGYVVTSFYWCSHFHFTGVKYSHSTVTGNWYAGTPFFLSCLQLVFFYILSANVFVSTGC